MPTKLEIQPYDEYLIDSLEEDVDYTTEGVLCYWEDGKFLVLGEYFDYKGKNKDEAMNAYKNFLTEDVSKKDEDVPKYYMIDDFGINDEGEGQMLVYWIYDDTPKY